VDGLESKVGKLLAQQFSTTTKLKGEASMILGGVPNYNRPAAGTAGRQYGNTTFNYDLRLNFDTSYTGQDLLRTRLRSGNFTDFPFGSSSQPFKLDKAEAYKSQVYVDRLYYTFPVDKANSTKVTIGALVRNTEMAWLPTAYKSDVLDAFTTIGTSGVYNKATGEGIGIQWKQNVAKGKPAFLANVNYVVNGASCFGDANTAVAGEKNGYAGANSGCGVFNDQSGLNLLAQLGYKSTNWGAAFGYRYGTTGSAMRDGNGPAATTLMGNQYSNSIAFNAYWQPIQTGWFPSLSGGYGYNFVSTTGTPQPTATSGALSSKSWYVGLQWDDAFTKGNAAGVAFGQPSYASIRGPQGNPWLIEWFYRFQVSDNISVTPTLFYGSNIANNTASTDGNQSAPNAFNGLGGVIQTTFKF
jgi:hypothetical protein